MALVLAMALGVGVALASLAPSNVVAAAAVFLAGGQFVVGAACAVTVGVLELFHLVDTGDDTGHTNTRS